MKYLFIILPLLFLLGCGANDFKVSLKNKYSFWKLNRNEQVITNDKDEIIIGPTVVSIGNKNNIFYGKIARSRTDRNNPHSYYILHTNTGQVEIVEKMNEWIIRLKLKDILELNDVWPSQNYKPN